MRKSEFVWQRKQFFLEIERISLELSNRELSYLLDITAGRQTGEQVGKFLFVRLPVSNSSFHIIHMGLVIGALMHCAAFFDCMHLHAIMRWDRFAQWPFAGHQTLWRTTNRGKIIWPAFSCWLRANTGESQWIGIADGRCFQCRSFQQEQFNCLASQPASQGGRKKQNPIK